MKKLKLQSVALAISLFLISCSAQALLADDGQIANQPQTENSASANSDFVSELEISGFFDVLGNYQSSLADETMFSLGQAELDIERAWSERVSSALAIAYNNETGQFELGAAEIGVNLFAKDDRFITSADIVAGQFDVPFGIDYHVYGSIDRKLVTAPWFTDIHGGWRGWNDFGAQFQLTTSAGSMTTYWVNGFEESAEVTTQVLNLSTGLYDDVIEEINTTPANALGFHLAGNVMPDLEIGTSFALGLNESNKEEMTIAGADLQWTLNEFYFKSEYVSHSVNKSLASESHRGYYLQGLYQFERTFVTARYSAFEPDAADWVSHVSLGAGYKIDENVEFRLETSISETSSNNQTLLQLAAGF